MKARTHLHMSAWALSGKRKASKLVGVLLFFVAGALMNAARGDTPEDYQTVIDAQLNGAAARAKVGDFGDQIDFYTGELSFQHTDIELPGNTALRVALDRSYVPGHTPKSIASYIAQFKDTGQTDGSSLHLTESLVDFGDWTLEVPSVSGVILGQAGWQSQQCSGSFEPPLYTNSSPAFTVNYGHYWNGWTLDVPGHGSRPLLLKDSSTTVPFPASAGIVTDDNWIVTCLTNATNAAGAAVGEGYLATSPQGEKYYLNKLLYYSQAALSHPIVSGYPPDHYSAHYTNLPRLLAKMVATRVEDRFGNYVNYNYDSTGRLASIVASDGREIDLAWTTQLNAGTGATANVIHSATAAGKTWNYGYDGGGTLTSVTRPDGLAWTYSLASLDTAAPTNPSLLLWFRQLKCPTGQTPTGTMTTPEGLVGTFAMITRSQGLANGPDPNLPSGIASGLNPICHLSLSTKTLSGPGLSTSTWSYTYANNPGYAPGGSGPTTQWTQVTDPEGVATEYTFSDLFDWSEGNLVKVAVYPSGSTTASRTTVYTYQEGPHLGVFNVPQSVTPWNPTNDWTGINFERHSQHAQLLSRLITQDGDTYSLTTQSTQFDPFGAPLQEVRSNSFGFSATDTKTYLNDSVNWVIGSILTHTVNGIVMDSYIYTARSSEGGRSLWVKAVHIPLHAGRALDFKRRWAIANHKLQQLLSRRTATHSAARQYLHQCDGQF